MSLWLIRAGSAGENETKFITDRRVFATWDGLNTDLRSLSDRAALATVLTTLHPAAKLKSLQNWAGQLWAFTREIKKGDWIVLPLKTQRSIYIGQVTSDYQFDPKAADPYYHWRDVQWIGEGIPRQRFGKDLLQSLGAAMTICRIQRNNAEERLRKMKESGWKDDPGMNGISTVTKTSSVSANDEDVESVPLVDLEQEGMDRIASLIQARFSGHGLAKLVDGILRAQGYTTYRSPEGADGGADILAGMGALGFGSPQLCVEVKSQDSPIDRPTVDKLLGAMSKFNAPQGLFVSWGGFKATVQKELAQSFFKVRLWTQKELLDALFAHYDKLDDDLKAELPLKRIWTVAAQEEDGE